MDRTLAKRQTQCNAGDNCERFVVRNCDCILECVYVWVSGCFTVCTTPLLTLMTHAISQDMEEGQVAREKGNVKCGKPVAKPFSANAAHQSQHQLSVPGN